MKDDGKILIDMFKVQVNWTPRECIKLAMFRGLSHNRSKMKKK